MKTLNTNRFALWSLTSVFLIGTLVLFAGVSVGRAEPNEPAQAGQTDQTVDFTAWAYPDGIESYKDMPFVAGEILVGYHRDQVTAAGAQAQFDMQAVDTIDLRGLDGSSGDADVDGYVMRVPDGAEWATVKRLLEEPSVAFATPNWTVQAAGTSGLENDSDASIEIPFDIDDTFYAESQWYLQRINASRAWQSAISLYDDQNEPIRVAIIDSGADYNHLDLKLHLLAGENYFDSTSLPIDDYGHGTHVAGVVAATLNNEVGVSGLSPWVKIDPYKVLDETGGGNASDVSNAIKAAADNGARIINLSLETTADSSLIRDAVQYAARKNTLLVAAAGNCGSCPVMYPAAYDEVIAVAATLYDDGRADYSAVGVQVEIAAPGGGTYSTEPKIFSTWAEEAVGKCTLGFAQEDDSYYCDAVGTSMAAGIVSGVAALVWGLEPSMSSDAVRELLNRTASPLPDTTDRVGSGRVDAHAAVLELVSPDLEPSALEISHLVPVDSAQFRSTVGIRNPSSIPMTWTAELALETPWVQIVEPSTTGAHSTGYGEPGYIFLDFSPAEVDAGSHVNSLVLIGEAEGISTIKVVPINLNVYTELPVAYYLPYFLRFDPPGSMQTDVTVGTVQPNDTPFRWEVPADEGERVKFVMTDDTPWRVFLPFAFPFGDSEHDHVWLHADGGLTLSANDSASLPANRCLPSSDLPTNGIYGWWADLDPGQTEATVSGFALPGLDADADRYVFEFADVPSAASVAPGYVVSFQMVLYNDGTVEMNYLDVPSQLDLPPLATVGVGSESGRFHNQVFCADGTTTLRNAPDVRQTMRFTREDIY